MIHINQTGYGVNLPKKAVITGKGEYCRIMSRDGEQVYEPKLSPPRFDAASGDTARIADFTDLTQPGEYYLFADGLMKKIIISKEPYRAVSNALVKGMYYQRCGCALEEKHAGVYQHAVCHAGKATLIHDKDIVIDASGGWHDAGDYGRYVVPGAVAVGHMLYAYELFPGAYADELNIPESGNGTPDILNECRYELEWILKMQREDGGVYHKVATRYFAPFIMPEDDKEELLLFNVSHTAAATLASSCALAHRIFKPFDSGFADTLLTAARRAWDWLEANPVFEPFENPPDVSSGSYGDHNCTDNIFWAACELYAAGKEERYLLSIRELANKVDISKLGWRDVGGFGAMCCLFGTKDPDIDLIKKLRERLISAADRIYTLTRRSAYGTALEPDKYTWGSVLPIMNNAIILICAKMLTNEPGYQNAAQHQLDYLLGKNATGYSFVTGFGDNAFKNPHHRPSFADGITDPVPGLVSGGPNKQFPDHICKQLIPPDTPPAKFYIDYAHTASANENAVYWNSPAIFVAGYFAAQTGFIV